MPRHRTRPRAEPLEGRDLLTVAGLTASASPAQLRPISPRNQPHAITTQHVLPVTLAGTFVTSGPIGAPAPVVSYQVIDSEGVYQPSGTIPVMFQGLLTRIPQQNGPPQVKLLPADDPMARALGGVPEFLFNTRIGLSKLRNPAGRQYLIVITAAETVPGGGSQTAVEPVTVPPVGFFNDVVRVRKTYPD